MHVPQHPREKPQAKCPQKPAQAIQGPAMPKHSHLCVMGTGYAMRVTFLQKAWDAHCVAHRGGPPPSPTSIAAATLH